MNKRFYDQEKPLSKLVGTIEALPSELQNLVAETVTLVAVNQFGAAEKLQQLKSKGKDHILPLYKSMNKHRKLDQNLPLHQALNYLKVLDSSTRQGVTSVSLLFADLINGYWEQCNFCAVIPEIHKLKQGQTLFLHTERNQALQMVANIRKELIDNNPRFQKNNPKQTFVTDGIAIHLRDF